MANRNFFNELYEGIGNAVDDIRHKAVEEAFFGREVTGSREPQAEPEPDSERLWGSSTRHIEPEPAANEREPDLDIDR